MSWQGLTPGRSKVWSEIPTDMGVRKSSGYIAIEKINMQSLEIQKLGGFFPLV